MYSTGCAWVTFERKDLPVRGFHEVKGNLARELSRFDKCFYPTKYSLMINVLKGDHCALPGGEIRAIGSVGGDMSIVDNAVGADVCLFDIGLRDTGRFKCQRGEGMLKRGQDQGPRGKAVG